MSYTDDQVRTKLNTLADTQDSIEQVGQWALFHRRHAPRTATIWAQYLKDAPPAKRLNLIYLANEVVQQSRIKKKEDFPDAFTPLIADSLATAYSSATREVQGKLRRVVQVWRDRNIFDTATTDSIEAKLTDIDKTRGPQRRTLGGSLFGATSSSSSGTTSTSIPPELAKLADAQTAVTKAAAALPDDAQLQEGFAALAEAPQPEASALPAHSAHLSKLLKQLDASATAVEASIAARAALAKQLQALLTENSAQSDRATARAASLSARREELAARKSAAEDAILRARGPAHSDEPEQDPEPPEIEALTPPAIESFTPPPEAPPAHAASTPAQTASTPAGLDGARTPPGEPSPFARSLATPGHGAGAGAAAVVEDAFAGASRDPRRRGAPAAKRRRVAPVEEDEFTGDVMEGIDADVVGMLS